MHASIEAISEEVRGQTVGLLDAASRPTPFFLHVRVRNNNSKGMSRQALAAHLADRVIAERHPIVKAPGRVGVIWEGMSLRPGNRKWEERILARAAAGAGAGACAESKQSSSASSSSSSSSGAAAESGDAAASAADGAGADVRVDGRVRVSDAKWAVVVEAVGINAFVSVVPAQDYASLRGYAMPHTAMQHELDKAAARKGQGKAAAGAEAPPPQTTNQDGTPLYYGQIPASSAPKGAAGAEEPAAASKSSAAADVPVASKGRSGDSV